MYVIVCFDYQSNKGEANMDYDRIIVELLSRVSVLEEKVADLESGVAVTEEPTKGSKKYRKLTEYLKEREASGQKSVRLSFKEIEDIIGFELPESKVYRAFWANTESHSIALAWLCTSFRTVDPHVDSGIIVWEKM